MQDRLLLLLAEKSNEKRDTGKKAFQKLVYFAKELGVPFEFDFGIYLYGPYSSTLASKLDSLVMGGIMEYGSEGWSTTVKPGPVAEYALELKPQVQKISPSDHSTIEYVAESFAAKEPRELELLSTTHYVAEHVFDGFDTALVSDVVEEVKSIKGSKFTHQQIVHAFEELKSLLSYSPSQFEI